MKLYSAQFRSVANDLYKSWEKPMSKMHEFFTTIDENEDPNVEIENIGSLPGKLAYSTVAFFDRRLGHDIPTPTYERSDYDTDISYPFVARSFGDYLRFAYDFMAAFLNFAFDMPHDTFTNSCDRSVQDWADNVHECTEIYEDIIAWGKHPHFITNFKYATFVHVRFLELIYPTSVYCWRVDEEIKEYIRIIN